MSDFTSISRKYEHDSVVQKSASDILFDMLRIKNGSTILDLGCGTGHIAQHIQEKTNGTIIGVDPSRGMIEQAERKCADKDISFINLAADQLDFHETFDVIFCNSAFQWFKKPEPALNRCYQALKPNGKIGIQAPAKKHYCPNFIEAIDRVKKNQATCTIFKDFDSPWLFLNSTREYNELFQCSGFNVITSRIERVESSHSVEDVYKIFESGAAAGYLNQQFYRAELTTEYRENFRKIVLNTFEDQADNEGKIDLIFFRIYLLATRGQ